MVEITIRPLHRYQITFNIRNSGRDDVLRVFPPLQCILSFISDSHVVAWAMAIRKSTDTSL